MKKETLKQGINMKLKQLLFLIALTVLVPVTAKEITKAEETEQVEQKQESKLKKVIVTALKVSAGVATLVGVGYGAKNLYAWITKKSNFSCETTKIMSGTIIIRDKENNIITLDGNKNIILDNGITYIHLKDDEGNSIIVKSDKSGNNVIVKGSNNFVGNIRCSTTR